MLYKVSFYHSSLFWRLFRSRVFSSSNCCHSVCVQHPRETLTFLGSSEIFRYQILLSTRAWYLAKFWVQQGGEPPKINIVWFSQWSQILFLIPRKNWYLEYTWWNWKLGLVFMIIFPYGPKVISLNISICTG